MSAALLKPLGKLLIGRMAKYRAIEGRAVAAAMIRAAQQGTPGICVLESGEIAALAASSR